MINQGRYIINAVVICFVIFGSIIFFKIILKDSNSSSPGNFPVVVDTTRPSPMAIKGEQLFKSNCGACHALDADLTGPHLRGLLDRQPYNGDVAKVSRWIKNTPQLTFTDPYYKSLRQKFGGVVMPPQALPDEDLKAILEYLKGAPLQKSI